MVISNCAQLSNVNNKKEKSAIVLLNMTSVLYLKS
jgi:hypothetical protein